MALPVNIESLINENTVEWERKEFKYGWNPEEIIHSMCAFANDLHNWGGGYIIVGVAEENGQPILPPVGLSQNQLDMMQSEIVKLAYKILPNYFPIVEPYVLLDKHILVMWCPAGDNRPYTAPTTLGEKGQRQPYVRIGSRSMRARGESLRQLQELAARVPFDDRVNNQATLEDFDLGLIQAHLQEVKSNLFEESKSISFSKLCRTMLIAKGPDEDIRPVNVGLLFFSKKPETFFNRAWIELVWHQDDSGKKFKETYFKGPLQTQLRECLRFIQSNILSESVIKKSEKAEAERFYNYPYEAIEEVLSNAVYHKSYEVGSPIEVQVFPDKIMILSHPGPVPPVNAKILATNRHIVAREYRNRRIGDFLKELRLTEGRGTGFPTIYKAMENNGSPTPIFETDEQTHVLATLPMHTFFQKNDQVTDHAKVTYFSSLEELLAFTNQVTNQVSNQVSNQASNQARKILSYKIHDKVAELLKQAENWNKGADILIGLGLSNQYYNRKRYLAPLLNIGLVEMEHPTLPTHPNQRYKITESGKRLLNLIGE